MLSLEGFPCLGPNLLTLALAMRSLDLFRAKPDGTIEWCGTFFSMEAAKAKLQELLVAEPGDYFILDQVTGQKTDPNAPHS
jgi:hypothetical protein